MYVVTLVCDLYKRNGIPKCETRLRDKPTNFRRQYVRHIKWSHIWACIR